MVLTLVCVTAKANWIPSETMVEPNWLAPNGLISNPKAYPSNDGEVYTPLFTKFKTYDTWKVQFQPGGTYQGNATQSEFYLMSNRILTGFYKGNFGVMDSKEKINALLANLKEEPAGYTFEEGQLMIAVWDSNNGQMLLKPYRGKRAYGKTYGLYDEYGLYYPVVLGDYDDKYGPCFNLCAENINTVIELPGETKIVYKDSIVYITKEVPCLEDGDDCDCNEQQQTVVNNYYNQDCGCYQAPMNYTEASAGIWIEFYAAVTVPGPVVQLPPTFVPGTTTYGPDTYIPGDTTKGDDVFIPGDTIYGDSVFIPGDTIDDPNGTGDTIDDPNGTEGDSSILDNPNKLLQQDSLIRGATESVSENKTPEAEKTRAELAAELLEKKRKEAGIVVSDDQGLSGIKGDGVKNQNGEIKNPVGEVAQDADKNVKGEVGKPIEPTQSDNSNNSIKVIKYYEASTAAVTSTTDSGEGNNTNVGTLTNSNVKSEKGVSTDNSTNTTNTGGVENATTAVRPTAKNDTYVVDGPAVRPGANTYQSESESGRDVTVDARPGAKSEKPAPGSGENQTRPNSTSEESRPVVRDNSKASYAEVDKGDRPVPKAPVAKDRSKISYSAPAEVSSGGPRTGKSETVTQSKPPASRSGMSSKKRAGN